MLTVRLTDKEEKQLNEYAKLSDLSKSQIVKEALVEYISKRKDSTSAYALGADLFGLEGSNQSDKSSTYKARLKEKLRAKNSH